MQRASVSDRTARRARRRGVLYAYRALLLVAVFLLWYALTELAVLPGFFFGPGRQAVNALDMPLLTIRDPCSVKRPSRLFAVMADRDGDQPQHAASNQPRFGEPVTFELTILFAVCATMAGFFVAGRRMQRTARTAYDPSLSGERFGVIVACDSPTSSCVVIRAFRPARRANAPA